MTDKQEEYIKAHSKSQAAGFFLTLFFGPFGLFYSNFVAALVLIVVAAVSFTTIIGPIICWLLSVILTFFLVSSHNQKVRTTANIS